MNLTTPWTNLMSHLPAGLTTVLAIIGVAIIVIFVLVWLWKGRKGSGVSWGTFPWLALLIGAILAGPAITVPVVLTLIQALITIFLNIMKWIGGLL